MIRWVIHDEEPHIIAKINRWKGRKYRVTTSHREMFG